LTPRGVGNWRLWAEGSAELVSAGGGIRSEERAPILGKEERSPVNHYVTTPFVTRGGNVQERVRGSAADHYLWPGYSRYDGKEKGGNCEKKTEKGTGRKKCLKRKRSHGTLTL